MHEFFHLGFSKNSQAVAEILGAYATEEGTEVNIDLRRLVDEIIATKFEVATSNYTSVHLSSYYEQTLPDNQARPDSLARFAYNSLFFDFEDMTYLRQYAQREDESQRLDAARMAILGKRPVSNGEIEEYLKLYTENHETILGIETALETAEGDSRGELLSEILGHTLLQQQYTEFLTENKTAVINYMQSLSFENPTVYNEYLEAISTIEEFEQVLNPNIPQSGIIPTSDGELFAYTLSSGSSR